MKVLEDTKLIQQGCRRLFPSSKNKLEKQNTRKSMKKYIFCTLGQIDKPEANWTKCSTRFYTDYRTKLEFRTMSLRFWL